jgi:predicted O-methyltransferase YrrM
VSLRDEYIRRLRGEFTDIRFHLPYLYEVASSYDKVQVLELGVRDCNSTSAFLAAAEGADGSVRSVDIKEPKITEKLFAEWISSDRWAFIMANSIHLGIEPGTKYDVIFLDTSHHLYSTMHELRKYIDLVKPGGRLLLHDTEWVALDVPDSGHMLGEVHGWGPVAWALDWFCKERNMQWINHPGSYGLGEIVCP